MSLGCNGDWEKSVSRVPRQLVQGGREERVLMPRHLSTLRSAGCSLTKDLQWFLVGGGPRGTLQRSAVILRIRSTQVLTNVLVSVYGTPSA